MKREPYRCPICRVETKRGITCGYHKRNRAAVELGVLKRRIEHFVAIVCEAVDESRAEPRRNYHREYYHRNLERRRMQARESKRRRSARRTLEIREAQP